MFKVVEDIIISETGEKTKVYGIESEEFSFRAISLSRENTEKLCEKCNTEDLSDMHILDIVEDHINGICYGIHEESSL